MPTPAKNLWPRILEWDNLVLAAKEASRNKRFHRDVLDFNFHLEENVLRLRELLASGQWMPGRYRELWVYEPKQRLIHAPAFADRVVHHALVQVIGPLFERRFCQHSYACRVGKGTHAAGDALQAMLRSAEARWGRTFVLKADISKYFYSISHDILLQVIGRTIGDRDVMRLIHALVTECSCIDGNVGLPLGALTSQLFANAYLDILDHWLKDELGLRYYIRYMDDFVVLHDSKPELWTLLAEIRDFLALRLRLALNPKTAVFPASRGVDFAGYRHWASYALPRKRNVRRASTRFAGLSRVYARGEVELDVVRSSVASFVGYMQHCKGWKSTGSALERLVLVRPQRNGDDETH